MPCNNSTAQPQQLPPIDPDGTWLDDGGTTDRILFVSNCPENIPDFLDQFGAQEPRILYKCGMPILLRKKVRMFIWHYTTETARTLSVVVRVINGTSTPMIRNHRSLAFSGTNIGAYALCLADAQLFGTLDPNVLTDVDVSTALPIGTYFLNHSNRNQSNEVVPDPIAAIHEFEIECTSGTLRLWTGIHPHGTPHPVVQRT